MVRPYTKAIVDIHIIQERSRSQLQLEIVLNDAGIGQLIGDR
ncbi:MAG: hypothetical protein OXD01_09870 [Gammaproteobacteria bacterium]|nr:hypothetical protein [Gammaproteobacteria bacterium]